MAKWIILLPARSRKGTAAALKTVAYTKDGIVQSWPTEAQAAKVAKFIPGAKVEKF